MTKLELIDEVNKTTNLPADGVEHVVSTVFRIITAELAAGNKVQLIGFGTFEVHERAERQGTNPRTGEVITIPASKLPYFKPGKSLKAAVNA